MLLDFLRNHEDVSLTKFLKISGVSRFKAERTLINLTALGIISIVITERGASYKLNSDKLPGNI